MCSAVPRLVGSLQVSDRIDLKYMIYLVTGRLDCQSHQLIGLALPPKCIAVNLAPADVVKEGAHIDLPIALSLLIAMGVVSPDAIADLNAEAIISRATIAEALAYRAMPLLA